MKKLATFTVCVYISLNCMADNVKKTYLIHRGEEVIEVNDMPKFTVSAPIISSFVYVDGEYIESPYVVSVSNLAVLINNRVIQDYEPRVHTHEYYKMGGRRGTTPETVGESVDRFYKLLVDGLIMDRTLMFYSGGRSDTGMDDGSVALARIELARKATQGDEQAKQELIKEMGLENSLSEVRPDWIERLASNTNLETRATRILETKRERERKEQELRNQQNQ